MKDLSFFLLKNSIGAKMKKGIRNFCNADGSTSTLNQQQQQPDHMITPPSVVASNANSTTQSPPTTLEEMILRLELEEELARKAKLNEYSEIRAGRMSCVNNSDILRSARNALNQYPRFSLDGKDAMYRSSFRNSEIINGGRKSVCCDQGLRERYCRIELDKSLSLPSTFGGESVIWCKPGIIAKLMGLELMPVPINSCRGSSSSKQVMESKQRLSALIKRENLRRRAERHETERRLAMEMSSNNYDDDYLRRRSSAAAAAKTQGSCSKAGYCVMKPVAVEPRNNGDGRWPTRRFL